MRSSCNYITTDFGRQHKDDETDFKSSIIIIIQIDVGNLLSERKMDVNRTFYESKDKYNYSYSVLLNFENFI